MNARPPLSQTFVTLALVLGWSLHKFVLINQGSEVRLVYPVQGESKPFPPLCFGFFDVEDQDPESEKLIRLVAQMLDPSKGRDFPLTDPPRKLLYTLALRLGWSPQGEEGVVSPNKSRRVAMDADAAQDLPEILWFLSPANPDPIGDWSNPNNDPNNRRKAPQGQAAMKHGSIVWYNDGTHSRRFLFVTLLDDGNKARILDLDSGELIPRVVDAAALTLDDTDDGPAQICAELAKLTAATEAQTRTFQECNAAALDKLTQAPIARSIKGSDNKGSDDEDAARALASVEKIAASVEKIAARDSDLLAYLKIQQEGQQRALEVLLSSVRGMADDALCAFDRIERRREKTRRRTQEAEIARPEADLVAQAEVDALRRDVANQGKAFSDLRAEINKLRDEIKGDDDNPPAWFRDVRAITDGLDALKREANKLSSRLSEIENR